MQGRHVEARPCGRHESAQLEKQQEVSRCPMVLVHPFPTIDAAQDLDGIEVLHQASSCLQDNQNIRDEADDPVRRCQACMVALVDFDGEKGDDKSEQAERLDGVVDVCSSAFLGGQTGWLEDQTGLDLQQERKRVEQLSDRLAGDGIQGAQRRTGRTEKSIQSRDSILNHTRTVICISISTFSSCEFHVVSCRTGRLQDKTHHPDPNLRD